jgi:hypothetical protein
MGTASVLLAGCGGPQPTIGAPGAMPQSRAVALRIAHGGQGKRTEGTDQDLLYVATSGGILMLSWPGGKMIGKITSHSEYPYVCADPRNGDIFVPESGAINEYAHGGTSPIATLTPPSGYVNLTGCSVDPTTGNLAVPATNVSGKGGVLIFQGAQGTAQMYPVPKMQYYYYCAYDGGGDLFISGVSEKITYLLGELTKGSSTFYDVAFSEQIGIGLKIQWDGQYLALHDNGLHGSGDIYQISVSGSKATIVGTTQLTKAYGDYPATWIQGNTIIAPYGKPKRHDVQRLGSWNYPAGGRATAILTNLVRGKHDKLNDVTVSVAPPR